MIYLAHLPNMHSHCHPTFTYECFKPVEQTPVNTITQQRLNTAIRPLLL